MHVSLTESPDVKATFHAIKLKRAHAWMFVCLNEEKDTVIVHSTGEKGQKGQEAWDAMAETGDAPGIFIFDHANKLYKIYKCYDSLPVKAKMPIAAMNAQIKTHFDGTQKEINITEASEFTLKYFESRI
jgi:hypothetical protein